MSSAPADDSPPPIPYELRIGVTGHCEIERQEELAEVACQVVRQNVIAVLEAASADPFGPNGSVQPAGAGLFRAFTFVLAPLTRLFCPALRRVTGWIAAPLRWAGLPTLGLPFCWPVVPHTPRTPPAEARTPLDLTVVTSLAPGSDQIVSAALCACVRNPETRNRYLEAVLPIPAAVYEASFEREADRARFRELLALDRGRLGTHPNPTVVHAGSTDEAERSNAYRAAGRRVVDSCEILLAIWDPKRLPQPGGTEEAIRYAVDRGRVVLWLDPSDLARGPRCLRPPPADALQDPASPPGLLAAPLPTRAKELSLDFHRLAAYNRDAALDRAAYRWALAAERRRFRDASPPELPGWIADVAERELLPRFLRADLLATRYHELRDFVNKLLPTISVLALSLAAFQIFFLPALHVLAAVEIVLVVAGLASYRLSVREAWHEKWLSDRHLAERLRDLAHTFALEADPAGDPHESASERIANVLPFYSPTNAWFTGTLARLAGRARRARPGAFAPAEHVGVLRELIRGAWIEPQAAYHAKAQRHAAANARVSKRAAVVTIGAIILVASAHALGVGHGATAEERPLLGRVDLWIALLTLLVPAWGAAFQVVDAIEDHPRMAERAGRMAGLLRGLAEQLRDVESIASLRRLASDARRIIELEGHEHAESLRGRFVRFHG
jgi:hypothetical protein